MVSYSLSLLLPSQVNPPNSNVGSLHHMSEVFYKHTIKEVLDSCPESGHFSPEGDFAWRGNERPQQCLA